MFDPSAPHIIILLVVVLVLFGSSRLPGAADALGKSMHIFKKSVHGLDAKGKPTDEATVTQVTTAQQPAAPPQQLPSAAPDATQQQIQDLQRQVQDLQRQSASGNGTTVSGAPLTETQPNQQPL